MADRQIKGTLLLDYIRMIRANKDKDWNKYLRPEDWEIINGRVLPSVWYPFETWQRCGLAVFHLIAGGNMDIVRMFGRIAAEKTVKEVYKSFLTDSNPAKALERFVTMSRQLFNFVAMDYEKVGEKNVKIYIYTDPSEAGFDVFLMQMRGAFEYIVEATGGKNPKYTPVLMKNRDLKGTELEVAWG